MPFTMKNYEKGGKIGNFSLQTMEEEHINEGQNQGAIVLD